MKIIVRDYYEERESATLDAVSLDGMWQRLGGGDYHEENPDYDLVGYWCWDEISVEDATFDTTGYEMLPLDFCERGNIRSETYERANK